MESKLHRRDFLKVGCGLTFALLGAPINRAWASKVSTSAVGDLAINAWVRIHPNGQVSIYSPTVEMGQGSMTALPVIVAEEMDADWAKVSIEYPPIDPVTYGHDGWGSGPTMIIVGSISVEYFFDKLRIAGAQVRKVLMVNAAAAWGVPFNEVSTKPHFVVHAKSGRTLGYGDIASTANVPVPLPEVSIAELKKPADFRLIGSRVPRFDIPSKVNAKAIFSIDVSLPGMVYGVIERSPVFGSKPTLLNENEILKLDNVLGVAKLNHGIGVIATDIYSALQARKSLKIEWNSDGKAQGYNSQEESRRYQEIAVDTSATRSEVFKKGTFEASTSTKVHTADYYNDFVNHAQMEPLNAVVSISPDRSSAEVWAGTQSPAVALRDAAKALGLEESKVTFHRCFMGGGFGRKAARDYIIEACELAKLTDKPIKLLWTREDDIRYGFFRPMSFQRMKAETDEKGDVVSWEHLTVGTGNDLMITGAEIPFYSVPNKKIEFINVDHGVRTRSWRAEGHGPNKFAIESFVDELAAKYKIDPLEYRLRLLKDNPNALEVMNTVAKMASWGSPVKKGRARGMSFAERNSIAGCVCEVSLDKASGVIKVHHVWISIDAGIVVQPDNATAQVEGAVIMGISSALSEQITFINGRVEQSNFNNYRVSRCSDAPENITVKLIPSTGAPTGMGEVALPNIACAIANAFAKLTGKRLYHMPFTPERVKAVIGKGS